MNKLSGFKWGLDGSVASPCRVCFECGVEGQDITWVIDKVLKITKARSAVELYNKLDATLPCSKEEEIEDLLHSDRYEYLSQDDPNRWVVKLFWWVKKVKGRENW